MKSPKNQNEKRRLWVRKHFYQIFILVGLLVTILGGFLPYMIFAAAPSYSFKPGFSGFGIARNETHISPLLMVVGLGVEPPELWFQYFCGCEVNGTYNFLFVFPFEIIGETGSSGNLSFRATARGSVVWLSLNVTDVYGGWRNEEIWGVFSIENTFQSGTRGSYAFILPFGMGIDPDVSGDLQRNLHIGFYAPDANITLQVGLPSRYETLGTFPPVSLGPNIWVTPTNRTISSMEWQFTALQDSVTIHCEDSGEISFYESLPLISGVFIGIGFPMITTTIYDAVKEWSRKKPRKPKEKLEQENRKLKEKQAKDGEVLV